MQNFFTLLLNEGLTDFKMQLTAQAITLPSNPFLFNELVLLELL